MRKRNLDGPERYADEARDLAITKFGDFRRVRPGEPPQLVGKFPEGTPQLLLSSNERTGVMLSVSSKSKSLRIFRLDGSAEPRELPIPEGIDPAKSDAAKKAKLAAAVEKGINDFRLPLTNGEKDTVFVISRVDGRLKLTDLKAPERGSARVGDGYRTH